MHLCYSGDQTKDKPFSVIATIKNIKIDCLAEMVDNCVKLGDTFCFCEGFYIDDRRTLKMASAVEGRRRIYRCPSPSPNSCSPNP